MNKRKLIEPSILGGCAFFQYKGRNVELTKYRQLRMIDDMKKLTIDIEDFLKSSKKIYRSKKASNLMKTSTFLLMNISKYNVQIEKDIINNFETRLKELSSYVF